MPLVARVEVWGACTYSSFGAAWRASGFGCSYGSSGLPSSCLVFVRQRSRIEKELPNLASSLKVYCNCCVHFQGLLPLFTYIPVPDTVQGLIERSFTGRRTRDRNKSGIEQNLSIRWRHNTPPKGASSIIVALDTVADLLPRQKTSSSPGRGALPGG